MNITIGTVPVAPKVDYDELEYKLRSREALLLRRPKDGLVILGMAQQYGWSSFNKVEYNLNGYVISSPDNGATVGAWYTGYKLIDFVPYDGPVTLENS